MPVGIEDHNFRYQLEYKNLTLNRKRGLDASADATAQNHAEKSGEEAKNALISNT